MLKQKLPVSGVEVLELAKSENYQEVTFSENSQFVKDLNAKYSPSDETDTEEADYVYQYYVAKGKQSASYLIQIGLKNYYPADIEEEKQEDLIKILTVKVFYAVGDERKSVDFSIILQNA